MLRVCLFLQRNPDEYMTSADVHAKFAVDGPVGRVSSMLRQGAVAGYLDASVEIVEGMRITVWSAGPKLCDPS